MQGGWPGGRVGWATDLRPTGSGVDFRRPMRGEGDQWRVTVCVRSLKEKRLELSTPDSLHTAGSWHAMTQRSKGQAGDRPS